MNISDNINIDNIQTNIFNGKLKGDVSICNLNHNKTIACYRDYGNGHVTACILNIDNNTVTPESEVVLNSWSSCNILVSRLTDDKAIVCYRDVSNNNYGTAYILDVSNNTITPGSKVVFNSGHGYYISVSRLTDTKAIICYTNDSNSDYGTACILNIDNNTITSGNKVVFNSGYSRYISVDYLTDNKAIVCYTNDNNSEYGTACILDINNDTITSGNKVVFNREHSSNISVSRLTDNRAIISYRGHSDKYITICILDTENNNILNKYQISNEIIEKMFIRKINDDYIVVCYNANNNGICEIIKIENDDIFLNKYGIIIDHEIESINYVSEIHNNKINIIYNKNDMTHNQMIRLLY